MAIQITIDTDPFSFSLLPAWVIGPLTLQAGGSVDISKTLPAGTPSGGTFAVKANAPVLPTGVSLSAAGLLSAIAGAPAASVSGVIFTYTYSA